MSEKKKYGLIIIPEIDAKMKYFLINLSLFTLASLMRRLIPQLIEDNFLSQPSDKKELDNLNYYINHSFFDLFSNFTADILSGIIILIIKCIEKIQLQLKSQKITTTNGIKDAKKMKQKSILYLSIIALIDFLAQLCLFIFAFKITTNKELNEQYIDNEKLYFTVLLDIISRYIFSIIFLQSYFYNYHYFAIIITCIGFIPLIIKNIFFDLSSIGKIQFFYLLLNLFMILIYSLEDVFNKICFRKTLLRPYELMFYKALIQIILVIPLSIYVFSTKNLSGFISEIFTAGYIWYRLAFIICNILRTWSLLTVIEIIDANCLSILKSFEFAVLFLFIYLITSKKDKDPYLTLCGTIATIISIIGTMIHNELIIINKWGFLEKTVYYKSIRFIEDKDLEKSDNKNKTADSLLNSSSFDD